MKATPKKGSPLPNNTQVFKPNHRPFLIRNTILATSSGLENKAGEMGVLGKSTRQKLCKKCESLASAIDNDTIHSTLAYSRCRCHRLFKYRIQKQTQQEQTEKVRTTLNGVLESDSLFPGNSRSKLTVNPTLSRESMSLRKGGVRLTHVSNEIGAGMSSIVKPAISYDTKPSPSANDRTEENIQTGITAATTTTFPLLPVLPALSETGLLGNTLLSRRDHKITVQKLQKVESNSSILGSKLPPITSNHQMSSKQLSSTSLPKQSANELSKNNIVNLVGLVKFIDHSKRKQLKEIFKNTDKNDDGHISCAEFIQSLPKQALSKVTLLKKFYAVLNDATYFGCREFILCYCIAERICNNIKSVDMKVEFLEEILSPFMKYLASLATDGHVTLQNISAALSVVNSKIQDGKANLSLANLPQATLEGKVHILDCLALAPYFLVVNT